MKTNLFQKIWQLFVIFMLTITLQYAFADLSVELVSPVDGASFRPKSTIIMSAIPVVTSGTLREVRFYHTTGSIGKGVGEEFTYEWKNVKSGNYYVYARVSDTDNNYAYSDTIKVRVGDISRGDVIKNGDFDISLAPWQLQNSNGSASKATIYNDIYFEDSSYVYIDMTSPGTETWHTQLLQTVPLIPDHTYEIWFYCDADERKQIQIAMQMNHDPWTTYYAEDVVIDGAGEYGPYTFVNTFDDATNVFKFNIAGNTIDIFFDRVRIIDRSLTSISSENLFTRGLAAQFELFPSYPNPFNMSTNIQYRLSKTANVTLNIYNIQGQLVRTLLNENKTPGLYTTTWDGVDNLGLIVPSGVYFYRMEIPAENVHLSSKVLLLK